MLHITEVDDADLPSVSMQLCDFGILTCLSELTKDTATNYAPRQKYKVTSCKILTDSH